MALTEDLSDFIDTDEFAVAATYNGSATVNGLLEHAYIEVPGPDTGVESTAPAFLCLSSDVPSAAHGDTLLIGGVNYTVRGVQPDGTGMVALILESSTDPAIAFGMESLADFLDTGDFAIAATYNGATVNGILEDAYIEVPVSENGVESTLPAFLCRAADVSGVAHDDQIAINSNHYEIRGVEPDGTGMVALFLEQMDILLKQDGGYLLTEAGDVLLLGS